GANLSLENFSAALCTQTLLGGDRLVIIDRFKVPAEQQAQYIAALQGLPLGVTVVFRRPESDKRTKLFKWLAEHAECREFRSFAPWQGRELIAWLKERTQGRGKVMSDGAARILQEISGSSLRSLDNEIEKIVTYVGERTEINEDDVEKLASPGEVNAFALLDALRAKNARRALDIFQLLLRNREDLFQLLGLLAWQYRIMLQLKAQPAGGAPGQGIAASPFFVKRCLENLGRFNLEELKGIMSKLLATNLKLKSGEHQAMLFEIMLLELCGS
ncbi:MAG: DNA polymerase III subunit delta, partial [Candidatus Margulisiibacteriota bacterium]